MNKVFKFPDELAQVKKKLDQVAEIQFSMRKNVETLKKLSFKIGISASCITRFLLGQIAGIEQDKENKQEMLEFFAYNSMLHSLIAASFEYETRHSMCLNEAYILLSEVKEKYAKAKKKDGTSYPHDNHTIFHLGLRYKHLKKFDTTFCFPCDQPSIDEFAGNQFEFRAEDYNAHEIPSIQDYVAGNVQYPF
jgi:hypothetical protein